MNIKEFVEVDATAMHVMRVDLSTPGHEGDARSALRYITAAHDAEPLFVIRGRDALAFPALQFYRELCEGHGLGGMARQVAHHAERFQGWQAGYAELTKLPDPYPDWPKISVDEDVSEDASPFWTSSARHLPEPPDGFKWALGGWMGGTHQRPWPRLVPVDG